MVTPVQPNTTFDPTRNPVPAMVSVWFELDPVMGFGLSEVIAGAGVTVDQ